MTTRGFREKDIIEVANYIDQAIKLTMEINKSTDSKSSQVTLKEFKENMKQNQHATNIQNLKHSIESFACNYPMPGFDKV